MKGRRLPLVICAGFALIGLVMVVAGEYALGAITVLLFGIGGLALATPALTSRGKDTVRIAEIDSEPGFLFPLSRAKQSVTALAALGMAAAGVLIALSGGVIVGVLCAVVFGGFAALGLTGLTGTRGLALTPTRVVVLGNNARAELDWDDVASFGLFRMARNRMLGITATAPEHVRRGRGGWAARFDRSLTSADLLLPADQLAGRPEHVEHALARYLDDPALRGRIGTTEELARLL